jgi:uncharacterized protein (DUF2252 family)
MTSVEKDKDKKVAVLHDNTATPRDDRRVRGKALRAAIPCKSHAGWKVSADRPDPLDLLKRADKGRIDDLIPIRYGRMLQSPFTFYRGAASVMASDLATTPISKIYVQACGDCHALNFGAFATPERNVAFDINDFDETLPGAWEWDIKRLAVSLVLIARDNGLKPKYGLQAAETVTRAYREKMAEFSRMAVLDIWYAKVEWEGVIAQLADTQLRKNLKEELKKAQKHTMQSHYFPKMTHEQDGQYLIKDTPPLIYHVKDDGAFIDSVKKGLEIYKTSLQEDKQRLLDRYRLCDIAIKVVGIGSVGTTCAVALMMAPDNEPLMLQIKEANASVLEPYAGKSAFDNHGQRVVAGQRIMQSASDIFLGWMQLDGGRHFYVRQLRDTKVKLVTSEWENNHLVAMAEVLGGVLARAHARSGDSAVISGYLGDTDEFDRAIADFSVSYADQMEKDHAALGAAVRSGRIKVKLEEDT